MVIAIVAVIIAYFIFNKSNTPASSPSLQNAGGTSTPRPTTTIPPFYQQDNAATEASPTTTLTVDKTPSNVQKTEGIKSLVPIRINPIPYDSIADIEPTSNAQEQAVSYANNGVGKLSIPVESPVSAPPFAVTNLSPRVTNNSPISVPHSNIAYYHEEAATIAPLPPVQPTFERVIPVIAAKVTIAPNITSTRSIATNPLVRSTFFRGVNA